MIYLRPYTENDTCEILSWCNSEDTFYKWTAGRLGSYPITPDNFVFPSDSLAFTAYEKNEKIGFFTLLFLENNEIKLGFIILNPQKRGLGLGKKMLFCAFNLAFNIFDAEKVSLGVFENNKGAYYCYKSVGFIEDAINTEIIKIKNANWKYIGMMITKEQYLNL